LTLTTNNTYTGDTTVNGGTLELSGSGAIASSAKLQINVGGVLDVSGVTAGFSSAGPVNVNGGTLVVRNAGAGTITSLTLTNAHVRLATLGGTNVVASALNLGGATNLIDVTSVGFITSYPTQFTVIKYTGAISGSLNLGLGAVPSPTTVGYVSNNVANSSVDLVLLDGPKPLTWTGTRGRDWDLGTTTNWLAFGTTPVAFLDADSAIFGDGASTNVVNLTTILSPGTVLVSNPTLNYTFTGPGHLSGFGGLSKDGAGMLTLANTGSSDFKGGVTVNNGVLALGTDNAISGGTTIASGATVQVGTNGPSGSLPSGTVVNDGTLLLNRSDDFGLSSPINGSGVVRKVNANTATLGGVSADYAGQILVAQGTLKAGGSLGGATSTVIVSNAATLDVNGQTLNATMVRVRGTGVGGQGVIVNSGADSQNALGNVVLEANTTWGGTSRWDIRGGLATLSTESNPYTLTKVGTNQVSLVGVTVDGMLGNINVQQGTLSVETTTGELGDPTKALTVSSGATLQFWNTTYGYAKPIVLNGDGVTMTVNAANQVGNTLAGTVTLNGNCVFNAAANAALTLAGTVSGSGSLTQTGPGTNLLQGTISYTGATTVSNGTLVVNSAKGAAAGLTVANGTLSGYGSLAEPVVIGANGVLAPGDANVPNSPLAISHTLTLSGSVVMDVFKSGGQFQNDVITNVTVLTLGGRLQVNVDTNGEALANGDTIKLFSFNSASGNVSEILPATPGAGLFWDKSQLPVNGTLRVTATPQTAPEIDTVVLSGTNLVFSGSGGAPGAPYLVLSSTNLTLPLANWIRVQTNVFDANGNFAVTNAVKQTTPQEFFRTQLQ
jgi:autotransporter-associated beta strand protein